MHGAPRAGARPIQLIGARAAHKLVQPAVAVPRTHGAHGQAHGQDHPANGKQDREHEDHGLHGRHEGPLLRYGTRGLQDGVRRVIAQIEQPIKGARAQERTAQPGRLRSAHGAHADPQQALAERPAQQTFECAVVSEMEHDAQGVPEQEGCRPV